MRISRLALTLTSALALATLAVYGCVSDQSGLPPVIVTEDGGATADGTVFGGGMDSSMQTQTDSGGGATDAGTSQDAGKDAAPPPPPVDGGLLFARHFPLSGAFPPFATLTYDNDGNLIAGAIFNQPTGLDDASVANDGGGFDFVVTKFSRTGDVIWMVSFGGAGEDDVDSIATDSSGNVFLAGRFNGATFGPLTHRGDSQYDGFVMKLDGATGAYVDAVDVVATGGHTNGVKIASHGADIALAASIQGNASVRTVGGAGAEQSVAPVDKNSQDVFVALLSGASLEAKWRLFIGGTSVENMADVATGPDGDVYVAGMFQSTQLTATGGALMLDRKSTGSLGDAFITRIESTTGVPQWVTGYGMGDSSTNYVYARAVAVSQATADAFLIGAVQGSVPIGTKTAASVMPDKTDAVVARLAGKDGATVWARSFGGAGADTALNGAAGPADGVYLGGNYFSAGMAFDGFMLKAPFSATQANLFTARLASDGTTLWAYGIDTTTSSSYTQASGAASFEDAGLVAFGGAFKGFVDFGDNTPTASGAYMGTPGQLYDLFVLQRSR